MKRVTKTFYISAALILVFSFALLASAYALSKAPTEERDYTEDDFVDGSLFESVEKKENVPVPQSDMKTRFGIYDHASQETGENGQATETLRLFSEEQASELNIRRQSGEYFVLSYDEIIFLINDSIQKYFKYDKILLTNAKTYDIIYQKTKCFGDTDIDCYHGDFSELPYYAASDKYSQMIDDIYDVIIYRIASLDSSFFLYTKTPIMLYCSSSTDVRNVPNVHLKSFSDLSAEDSVEEKTIKAFESYIEEHTVSGSGSDVSHKISVFNIYNKEAKELDAPLLYAEDSSMSVNLIEKDGRTVSALYPTRELEAMRPAKIKNTPSMLTKEDVYHASLNTVDYFDTAEGSFTCQLRDSVYRVTFATDMINNRSYQHFRDSSGNDIEEYLADGRFLQYNNKDKMFREPEKSAIRKEDSAPLDDNKRLVKEPPDGTPTMYYRADPTNISQSCVGLFPQAMTVGLLGDFSKWDLVRDTKGTPVTQDYAGRKCRVIEGKANYQGIKSFTLYVDTQTGVWLYCKGIDFEENAVFLLTTQYFKEDHEVNITLDSDKYSGYKENKIIE